RPGRFDQADLDAAGDERLPRSQRVGGAIEAKHGKAAPLRRRAKRADGLVTDAHRGAGLGSKAVEAHGQDPGARAAAVLDARDYLLSDEAALVAVHASELIHVRL